MQKPSKGRIVLFHEAGGPYASLVTDVNPDGTVELATFGKNSLYFQHNVPQYVEQYSTTVPTPEEVQAQMKGKWSWPPRETATIAPLPVSSVP